MAKEHEAVENASDEQEVVPACEDTKHEPHEHARPRLLWGVAAVLVVIVAVFVWARWGEAIKEACLGEDVCEVEIEGVPEGGTAFEAPAGF